MKVNLSRDMIFDVEKRQKFEKSQPIEGMISNDLKLQVLMMCLKVKVKMMENVKILFLRTLHVNMLIKEKIHHPLKKGK